MRNLFGKSGLPPAGRTGHGPSKEPRVTQSLSSPLLSSLTDPTFQPDRSLGQAPAAWSGWLTLAFFHFPHSALVSDFDIVFHIY